LTWSVQDLFSVSFPPGGSGLWKIFIDENYSQDNQNEKKDESRQGKLYGDFPRPPQIFREMPAVLSVGDEIADRAATGEKIKAKTMPAAAIFNFLGAYNYSSDYNRTQPNL